MADKRHSSVAARMLLLSVFIRVDFDLCSIDKNIFSRNLTDTVKELWTAARIFFEHSVKCRVWKRAKAA
jgi:hypothetical protein